MNKTFLAAGLACALMGAEPEGLNHWSSADLKTIGHKLPAKLDARKFAGQSLANWGNHTAMLAHREASGIGELHQNMADIFVVQSGAATLLVGGRVVDEKTESPGEIRGASVEGGQRMSIAAGDIVHIPANTPHQMLLNSGGQITYVVIKVAK